MSQQLQNELREEINLLISEAEELLNTRAAFYTEGNKLAITDMLNLAKQTLQPQYEAPFTRNRSFYNVTALEKLQFIVKRYTMVPPFQQEGDVYTHYGLEQLIHWFKQQDSMYGSAEQILARAKLTCQQSEELLQQTVIGDEVGQFPRAYVEHLQQDLKILQQQLTDISRLELTSSCTQPKTKLPIGQLEHLEHSEQLDRFEHLEQLELAHTPTEQAQFAEPQNIAAALQQLALQTVACRNSLRACRHARILRSDIEPACNLYISEQQRPAVLEAIVNDPIIASYYEQIKLNAERFNLDYIKQALNDISYEQASYEQLNQRYTLWS